MSEKEDKKIKVADLLDCISTNQLKVVEYVNGALIEADTKELIKNLYGNARQ